MTVAEMLAEAERELASRRLAYVHWLELGRRPEPEHERRIELMEAIVNELARRENVQ